MITSQYNLISCSLCRSADNRVIYRFNYHKFGLKAPFILVGCSKCGHVFNNPRLKTEQLDQLYNQDYYVINDVVLEKRIWSPAWEDYVNKVRPLEEKATGRNLLDIGCGMGFLLKICRDNGWQAQGVDVSSIAVKYARERFGLQVSLGRIKEVDFGNKKFHIILALDLLEHIEEPKEFLNACFSLLAPGGVLIIETPNIASIYKKITGRFWVGFNPYHIQLYSKDSLSRLIAQTDFKILEMHTTYNDIFARRNLWRWVSTAPLAKTAFSRMWRLIRYKLRGGNIYADISKIDTNYENLNKAGERKKLKERRDNFFGRRFLGDQLVACLIKD